MNFNIGKIVKMANMVKSPKEGINMLLDSFGKKNPDMAKTIRQAINSNKNPKQFIMEQAQSGNITLDNLNELKKYYNIAQKFGLSKKVPSSVWQEAENAIRNGVNGSPRTNTQPNSFVGF